MICTGGDPYMCDLEYKLRQTATGVINHLQSVLRKGSQLSFASLFADTFVFKASNGTVLNNRGTVGTLSKMSPKANVQLLNASPAENQLFYSLNFAGIGNEMKAMFTAKRSRKSPSGYVLTSGSFLNS